MLRPRIIPVLLLKNEGLVKSKQFRQHRYIGDPLNTVRLFNDLKADELIFLDILAGTEGRVISESLLKNIAEEAEMPFGIGGGFNDIARIKMAILAGAEKVVLGAAAALRPDFVREVSDRFGASSVSVCIDVKKNFWGKEMVWIKNGQHPAQMTPVEMAVLMQEKGAGELIVQSIDRDGMMGGYDIDLIKRIACATTIPVVALGGAGNEAHFREAYFSGMASAVAAGSRFVYQGARNGVLINYPESKAAVFYE